MTRRRSVPAAILMLIGATVCVPLVGAERTLAIDAARSHVLIHVGKKGVFGFAGHDHEVAAREVTGSVDLDPADWTRSKVSLQFAAAGLRVTGKGDPEKDVPDVQRVMTSDRVLDVSRFPTITFRSTRVSITRRSAQTADLVIDGVMALHGVTRPVAVHASVSFDPSEGITARGDFSLKQTDFGITPVTAAGGTVQVKDGLAIEFVLTAR